MTTASKSWKRGSMGNGNLDETTEFDRSTRASSYELALQMFPSARACELSETLEWLGDIKDKTVLEIGAGQGYLTEFLVRGVGAAGSVTACDNSSKQLENLAVKVPSTNCVCCPSEHLPLPKESFDLVVSLANFHHISDKQQAFSECCRVLKRGGIFLLVDVCNGTPTQRYFDNVVDKICSTGHKHTFLDKRECQTHCANSGFDLVKWELLDVPWKFESLADLGNFVHLIHDSVCSPATCVRMASEFLKISEEMPGRLRLEWQLFFMLAKKH
jgi:ubiquinone/menaquinone biosynthesis C-methylase UbiE